MRTAGPTAARRASVGGAVLAGTLALTFIDSATAAPRSGERRQGNAVFDSSAITPAMIDAGRGIFHQKGLCFACHGPQLEGTQIAPTLKAHAWRDARNGDRAAILGVVSKGVPSTAMVSFPGGISPLEARAVAAYVWSVGRSKVKP